METYFERQECEMKEANSELLSKRDEVVSTGVGFMGFWSGTEKRSTKITTITKSRVLLAPGGVSFFGGFGF